jgi:hypothetical protein
MDPRLETVVAAVLWAVDGGRVARDQARHFLGEMMLEWVHGGLWVRRTG